MRVRLDSEPVIYNGGRTYSWKGIVENLDEVLAEGFIPRSFLGEHEWVQGEGWVFKLTGRWVIQGNELARWSVERTPATVPTGL